MKERGFLEKMQGIYGQKGRSPKKNHNGGQKVTLNGGIVSTPTPCQIGRYLEEIKKQN